MKLLQLLTATSNTIDESIQQVYQTMQIVAEIEKFGEFFNDMREAWVGGIADFGDPQAAIQMQQHPQYDVYREALNRAVTEYLGDPFVAYRLMSRDQIEEWQSGADMSAIAVSTELSIAKAFRKLASNRGRDDLRVVQLSVPADAVIMLGHSGEHELVVDANYISAHEIQFLNEGVKRYSYWDMIEHYGLEEEAATMNDLALPWLNDNRPGKISSMARKPGYRLLSQLRLFMKLAGHRNYSNKVVTPKQFEAALNKPIQLWRGGGGEYDPDYATTRSWSSFTADERRVKTFSQYDGTYGTNMPGQRLSTRDADDSWEVALTLPLKDILLYLPNGYDEEVIVSNKNAKHAQRESRLTEAMLLELQEIGDPSRMTSKELKNQLEDAGWAKVDDGDTAYSNVYGKEGSPWVVKILKVMRRGSASTRFQCAMQWYRYCLKNWQNNPHLPRIPFVKTLIEGSRDVRSYVVMLERLEEFYVDHYEWRREDPLDNAIMFSVMAAVAGLYEFNWMDDEDVQKVFPTLLRILSEEDLMSLVSSIQQHAWIDETLEPGSDEWFASFSKALLQHGGFSEIGKMMEKGIAVGVERGNLMAIAMEQIHKAGEDNGCEIDLHIGNVMVRPSTNELVITDPVQG